MHRVDGRPGVQYHLALITRAWAAEFGPHGVRVNAISAGVVLTPVPGEVHPGEVMMKGTPGGPSWKP